MNITKSLVAFGIAAALFVGCKDSGSKPTATGMETATEKKVSVAAVKPETATFKIEGMTCAMGCARTIETKLSNLEGVQKATVDFDKKEATVEFDATLQTPEKLTKTVEAAGDGETYKVLDMHTNEKI